ncbi:MAG: LysR family transcriptional regulator [Nannocystaceae bacterium]|nr:LysR family transcriptional regulator [Nannocystaceae bacterium]
MDWDHLRTFESVARLGGLTAASKALGVSQSTVSRQLKQLEARAGSPLLVRDTPVTLTPRGKELLAAVAPMIEAALRAEAALDDRPELEGTVSVATVGELARWVLIPALPGFYTRHPRLSLRVLASNRVSSLAAGDADVALRFVRPERGDLVARKIHTEHYALFASRELGSHPGMPWLGLTGSLAEIAEQKFAERVWSNRPAKLLVEDLESLGLAVREGLGIAVLPRGFASQLPNVVEVEPATVGAAELGPLPSRALWMVVHAAKARVPKVRAVMDWAADVFGKLAARP